MKRQCLCASIVLSTLASCTQITYRVPETLDLGDVEALVVGETELGEALARLGPPMEIGSQGDHFVLLYERLVVDELQLGIGLADLLGPLGAAGSFIDLLKLSYGSSDSERLAALLVFDGDRVLRGRAISAWGESFGRSGGIQLIVNVEGVVDPGSLQLPPRALGWGKELLQVGSRGLNLPHFAAIELRGSRGDVGQRALEWN